MIWYTLVTRPRDSRDMETTRAPFRFLNDTVTLVVQLVRAATFPRHPCTILACFASELGEPITVDPPFAL